MKHAPDHESERKSPVTPFLIISVLLHVILLLVFFIHQLLGDSSSFARKEEPKAEVQFIDLAQFPTGRLVEQNEKEKTKDKPKDAKYLSAQDKKVEKETVAAHRGDFQNKNSAAASASNGAKGSPQSGAPAEATEAEAPESTAENMKMFEGGDFSVAKESKNRKAQKLSDLRPSSMSEMSQAAMASVSQTNDYIKDVAAGSETHLSTREFLYYSYFNRIKRQLHQRWEPLIHAKVRVMLRKGLERNLASSETKVTNVVFTLDDKGVLTRIQVGTTSGFEDLDNAAIEALKSVGQFPNPPKDLIQNGIVKINWSFILES